MNWDHFLTLNFRKVWIIIISAFLSMLIHNGIYALFEFEEPVFLIIVLFILPLYFFVSLIHTLGKWIRKGGLKEFLGK